MVKRKRGTNGGPSRHPTKRRKMTAKVVKKIVKDTVEKSEPKVHRLSPSIGGTYLNGSDTNQSILEIAQGDSSSTRIGSKARIVRVYIKLRMALNEPSVAQSEPMTIRIGLDYVKPGVLEGTTGPPARSYFTKPDYVETTKRVLWDKTFVLKAAQDGDVSGGIILFSKMITLKNHEVRWVGDSTVQPRDGNLILWAFAECPNSSTQGMFLADTVDVYYSEV